MNHEYVARFSMKEPTGRLVLHTTQTQQETSDQLLAAILDLSAGDRSMGRGAVNGGVNFAEQTSQDILEVKRGPLHETKNREHSAAFGDPDKVRDKFCTTR